MTHTRTLPRTAALLAMAGTLALGAQIEVSVSEIRSDSGNIMVALHSEDYPGPFPDERGAVSKQMAKAAPGTARFVFGDLRPGKFAVAVYHDENGNGELDTGFLGIPKEGYGFTRNAKATFGPPSFSAAEIELASEEERFDAPIKMKYRDGKL